MRKTIFAEQSNLHERVFGRTRGMCWPSEGSVAQPVASCHRRSRHPMDRHRIRFVFALHDHQPIGNFDGVFEQAYQDSYRLFLDLNFEQYPLMRVALHTSGPLMEWLDAHHPDYLDRLAGHVAAGRIEIIGGAFYEPILSMIPPARPRRPNPRL